MARAAHNRVNNYTHTLRQQFTGALCVLHKRLIILSVSVSLSICLCVQFTGGLCVVLTVQLTVAFVKDS